MLSTHSLLHSSHLRIVIYLADSLTTSSCSSVQRLLPLDNKNRPEEPLDSFQKRFSTHGLADWLPVDDPPTDLEEREHVEGSGEEQEVESQQAVGYCVTVWLEFIILIIVVISSARSSIMLLAVVVRVEGQGGQERAEWSSSH